MSSDAHGVQVSVPSHPTMGLTVQQTAAQAHSTEPQSEFSASRLWISQPSVVTPGAPLAPNATPVQQGHGEKAAVPERPVSGSVPNMVHEDGGRLLASSVSQETPTAMRVDPGGRVVWAKVGSYPWWPAKVLTKGVDASFPLDEEPPRPNAISLRFFGTHDFCWLGSKRAMMDWEEGRPQCLIECSQESFLEAVKEVEAYQQTGILPDAFYSAPHPQGGQGRKRPAGSVKGRKSEGKQTPSSHIAGGQAPAVSPEERRLLAQAHKHSYLQKKGLVAPERSPYIDAIAINPGVLALQPVWAASHATVPQALYTPYAVHVGSNQ